MIDMKCQALFSLQKKKKKIKVSSVTVVISAFNPGPAEAGYALPLQTVSEEAS